MAFETKISVPTKDSARLSTFLARAGCVVLDVGERTTTDDGWDHETSLHVLVLEEQSLPVAAGPTP